LAGIHLRKAERKKAFESLKKAYKINPKQKNVIGYLSQLNVKFQLQAMQYTKKTIPESAIVLMMDKICLKLTKPESKKWKLNENNVFILDNYEVEIFNFKDWDDVFYLAPELEVDVDLITRES
jgi:hypothetical protein